MGQPLYGNVTKKVGISYCFLVAELIFKGHKGFFAFLNKSRFIQVMSLGQDSQAVLKVCDFCIYPIIGVLLGS